MPSSATTILLLAALALGSAGAQGACNPGTAVFRTGFEAACENRARSAFVPLTEDRIVTSRAEVLAHTLELARPAAVFFVADGRHFPRGEEQASLWIAVDGVAIEGSRSVTNWREARRPVQHGFRVLATAKLPAGRHRVTLEADVFPADEGGFVVGSGSGLVVFVAPDSALQASIQAAPTREIDIDTYRPAVEIDVNEGDPDRPYVPVLSHTVVNGTAVPRPAVTLQAGHAYEDCDAFRDQYGDVLWGLWTDGVCPTTANGAWSVNDIDPNAEFAAPLYLHGLVEVAPGQRRTIEWGASELAFGTDQETAPAGSRENQVCYRAAGGSLVTATGDGLLGGAEPVPEVAPCSTYTWRCIGSTEGVSGCPAAGSWVVLGSAEFEIPPGHDGILYFSAITRIQGDQADGFVTGRLRLRVDGQFVGSTGVQQLAEGAGQASRTLSASWLAAPGTALGPLTPGIHRVEAVMNVSGERLNFVSAPRDLPLVYFD